MFIEALFTIVKTWKQVRCLLTDEWIKMWYVYILLSHEKKEFESVLGRWMNLEPVIQSEVSQKEKNKYCILTHIYVIKKNGTDQLFCMAGIETQM